MKRKATTSHGGAKRQAVEASELKWTPTDLPDMRGDAEGFFGLEEIEDVEVVRSEGQLQFVQREAKPKRKTMQTREQVTGFAMIEEEENDTDVSAWTELLSPELLSCVARLKFSTPTEIQREAIPVIQEGRDVIGKAATGSGKTLAFGIPIVERWLTSKGKALILAPTRELAHQITGHLRALCEGLVEGPSVVSVTGGLSVQKQQRQLGTADIVIGTPGRLWEMIGAGHLRTPEFLVVDEADRLLTEGHFKEVEEILNALEGERQTLVFSATFDRELQQKLHKKSRKDGGMEYLLSKLQFKDPKFIDINPVKQMAEGLREGIVECGADEKDLYLYALLMFNRKRTLVFTNSIHSVRRLTPFLQNLQLPALSLHSQMPQKARLRSIERFATGGTLVATDVAARGLDISGVELVVHYHVPRTADMYVHRSGRTARGEATGHSVLICSPDEAAGVRRLVSKIRGDKIRSIDLDRRIVSRLKPRVSLAKKITDSALAKEKNTQEDNWVKKAAEELGVEYDSDEFEAAEQLRRGRGKDRRRKEKEAQQMSKGELGAMRAELKSLLSQRVNVGVSEKYLTSSTIDIGALLRGEQGEFLGQVETLEMAD